jgi:glutamate synthase domain-containing protein 3
MVELEPLDQQDLDYVKGRVEKHVEYTGSTRGREILDGWKTEQSRFVKVMPTDYKRALAELRKLAEQEQQEAKKGDAALFESATRSGARWGVARKELRPLF